jgi:hypothetical protein
MPIEEIEVCENPWRPYDFAFLEADFRTADISG